MGSNLELVGNGIGTLFFKSVVFEGIWEGKRKPRKENRGAGKHPIKRSVSWVLGVQGLKQEGNCESRVLYFSTLITNSRLGELLV